MYKELNKNKEKNLAVYSFKEKLKCHIYTTKFVGTVYLLRVFIGIGLWRGPTKLLNFKQLQKLRASLGSSDTGLSPPPPPNTIMSKLLKVPGRYPCFTCSMSSSPLVCLNDISVG